MTDVSEMAQTNSALAAGSKPDPQMLAGLRVLEIGHFVAAPFCTRLLGDLGADVIKVEPPTGDPVRQWGEQIDGNSLWWSMHGRNKRSITLNLKSPKARQIVLDLVANCDVLVENFRPGQLARMGLGPDVLRAVKPDLVIAQISGYGQDGPYRDRAAFGVIGEAIGGLRYLTNHRPGESDLPPVRVGVSIGDSIAGLYAAFGIMAALWQRDRAGGDGAGRTIDVALTESVFSMMEAMLPEYGKLGLVKQPTGGGIATAAPSNAYPTADGGWMLIAANSEPLFAKLATLIGRRDLIDDPRCQGNRARVQNVAWLDGIIGAWTRNFTGDELAPLLTEADIPSAKAYTAADCAVDPQYLHRGMVREVDDPLLGSVLHAGVVPHVAETPGAVRWTGPAIGQHNEEVLGGLLHLGVDDIAALRQEGVI
jgi:crotonobetainyl-CoA:carnitine CoA-transferase CaiB-like acyl-CoA transferase